ncbi:hypothetical protein P22_0880 [Propionispora sp. 2/2-37]|uniref:class I adenylate-forming enzyme family protein n=1 Tax=Propionispora sp. 2/2-37 TaxID=1677858 RepID=UPI0006BB64B2|nr:AMP-binding protein [Propionispora sp. 2/2-37]CUH94814.1 hypothetical protein P22_0880 [Propionispora sp. 2/2-37]
MLIHSYLEKYARISPDKPCLIHGNRQLSYGELSAQSSRLACHLAVCINKGDAVLLKINDPLQQLLYFFGIIRAGGICIILEASASDSVCRQIIEQQHIACCITEDFILPGKKTAKLPSITPSSFFLGAFSSGSTGTPKLILRDHQSWTTAFPVQNRVFNLSRADTLYLCGSLSYTANLNACLHLLYTGGTVVLSAAPIPRSWVKEIRQYKVSAVFMVPANYKLLLKALHSPLGSITSAVSGGAKLEPSTAEELLTAFPQAVITEYYGASELGHISCHSAKELLKHPGSVGRAFPGASISIIDQTIWVESPYIAPAYKPKATVGDLGEMDKNGYLYIGGRKNGLINSGGIKIVPEEVEKILLQCPGIQTAGVGGIDDPIRGKKVCALLVRNHPGVTLETVLQHCRRRLQPQYIPQRISFVTEIPVTAAGKIDRVRLNNRLHHIFSKP